MSDKRQIVITSTRPNLSVTAWAGSDPTVVTSGYGGWEIVARPKRQGMTVWRGREPFQMEVPLLLDGFKNTRSVEADCTILERMALPPQELDEPPLVKISGPVPHTDLTYVINGIRWGVDNVVRAENGQRVRQSVTIVLLRYIAEDKLALQKATARARVNAKTGQGAKANGVSKPHVVKTGETLQSIAQKELGDYKRYKEIMALNDIRDAKAIKVGQSLRMP